MGDFNDDPIDTSIKEKLNTSATKKSIDQFELYNPMENMYKKGLNTLSYRDGINLFDQILLSNNLLGHGDAYESYKFYKAGIFNPQYLITKKGRYKGYPYRSFQNNNYTNGYSDHFPVYIYLIKNE